MSVPTNRYLEMKILTASPSDLIVMLYDGAIRFLKIAANELNNKNNPQAHANIVKAQNIISELNMSLDSGKGGEIAKNLSCIYNYVNSRLVEANIKKDAILIDQCIEILSNLNTAWFEISKAPKQVKRMGVRIAG